MNDEKNDNQKEQIRAAFAGLVRKLGRRESVEICDNIGKYENGKIVEKVGCVVRLGSHVNAAVNGYDLSEKLNELGLIKGEMNDWNAVRFGFSSDNNRDEDTKFKAVQSICENVRLLRYNDNSVGLEVTFPGREAANIIEEINKAANSIGGDERKNPDVLSFSEAFVRKQVSSRHTPGGRDGR